MISATSATPRSWPSASRPCPIRLPSRAGQGGRLFGSVTAADVVEAVATAGGPKLDRRRVELNNPIKSVGSHLVTVRLHPEVVGTLQVEVVPA